MIAIAITDRLGNQLFQYAAAKSLAVRNNTIVKIDKRYYKYRAPKGFEYSLEHFSIPQNFITKKEIKEYTGLSDRLFHKLVRRIYRKHQKHNKNYMYYEPFFHYDKYFEQLGDKVYMRGYWQSYKYFEPVENVIRKELSFRDKINIETDFFASDIISSNSVCVSVRRGELISKPEIGKKYGQYNKEYYEKGLELISSKENDNIKIFVFSDDIEWCRMNLQFRFPTIFVHSTGKAPHYYLQLMSFCNHFVIPVSTFPWWGAWLSVRNNKIVIAPKVWFTDQSINTNDLCPPDWVRL